MPYGTSQPHHDAAFMLSWALWLVSQRTVIRHNRVVQTGIASWCAVSAPPPTSAPAKLL